MAGRFMKIKRVVIPFMTLVVMTSQLAGCATVTSDETLKSRNESPDASIEDTIPDAGKQSLDASGVINVGNQRFVSDRDSDGDIGLIGDQNNQAKAELSGDELIEYFQKVYDIHTEIHSATTEEGLIQEELKFLADLAESDNYILPSDYKDQYRAWRPANSLPEADKPQQPQQEQQGGQQSKPSKEQSKPSGEQSQKPSGSTQTQQPSQPSGGGFDRYDGYGSYNAMIDAYCELYPELSREEIIKRNPDTSIISVDEETVRANIEAGRLHGG